jgi:DNA-binding response OmpR family regulator
VTPQHPITVLLVDDAQECLDTLDVALQAVPGLRVRLSHSAEDALEVLRREPIAAVITDLQLPAMSGLELISQIRGVPRLRSLPVLVVSAAPDPSARRTALEHGADAFFTKPFSPGAVRRKLEEMINGR